MTRKVCWLFTSLNLGFFRGNTNQRLRNQFKKPNLSEQLKLCPLTGSRVLWFRDRGAPSPRDRISGRIFSGKKHRRSLSRRNRLVSLARIILNFEHYSVSSLTMKLRTGDPWGSNKVTKSSSARKGNKGPAQRQSAPAAYIQRELRRPDR